MSIRDKARVETDGSKTFGAPLPSNGWHVLRVDEGITLTEPNEYGQSIMIPLVVDDKNDADNGAKFNYFVNVGGDNPRFVKIAEEALCTLLVQTGIDEKVDTALNFPDSLFEPKTFGKLVEMLKAMLPDKYIKAEIKVTDKGRVRLVQSCPVGAQSAGGAGFERGGVSYGK